jgi:hypothetical protein
MKKNDLILLANQLKWNASIWMRRCIGSELELETERATRKKAEAELETWRGWEDATVRHEWSIPDAERQPDNSMRHALLVGIIETNAHNERLDKRLTSALETVDALTRWRMQSDEPCPLSLNTSVEWTTNNSTVSCGFIAPCHLQPGNSWRHTPESWAEFRKTKEGGSDA